MRISTNGIVIATSNIDESDRILTILTSEKGVVRAYARGARRPGSKLCGSTELLCDSRFVLFRHKERYTVDAADSEHVFFGVRGDIFKLALASYLCELSGDTSPAEEEAQEYLRLLLNTLYLLETGRREPEFLKPVFELRQVSMAGYMPNLVGCSVCGRYQGEGMRFYPVSGELVCGDCISGAGGFYRDLSAPVLAAMRHILYADSGKLFSFSLSPLSLRELSQACEQYMKAQLSRTFKTLEFYHTLAPEQALHKEGKQDD